MEKLLIIAEKPSAAENFQKALGGTQGTFEGDTYAIVNLHGHVLAHETPENVAFPDKAATVGGFGNIQNMPWDYRWFDFQKRVINKQCRGDAHSAIQRIQDYLQEGYIPVIACDLDAMGEGDLLAQEVLTYLHYKGKIYREYHVDETPKEFQRAMREKRDVTDRNDGLLAATTRMTMDFLTQQIVRTATVTIQEQGYRLPRPVPAGRLQSTITRMVGDQIAAVQNYKPSSVWESRYRLDNLLMLTNPDVEPFPTRDAWEPGNLPPISSVRETKVTPGRTAPPKALSLTKLGKLLSVKGIPAAQTQALTQAMYDKAVLSYPRTEDDFLTPEQFQEMLPRIDPIIRLMGLSPEVFTHRAPRKTHVKEGGSHGALRPGSQLPKSLDKLDVQFGRGASLVYKTITERFLMMFLEDTEWVRHDYETTDTPIPFKGSLRIITKRGVTDPEEDTKDVAAALPNLSHKAELYAHEVKSTAPKKPTESWILGQVEKHNVGTASTQMATISRMIGKDENFPFLRGAKPSDALALSPIGTVAYQVAKSISLGTPECTRDYEAKIKQVVKGETTQDTVFREFTDVMDKDIHTIRGLSFDLSGLGFPRAVEKADGTWNGQKVSIPRSCNGYTFVPEELDRLFAGGEVSFTGTDFQGRPLTTTVKLGPVPYKGKTHIGFHDANYYYGNWRGEDIKFKRSFMGHRFTDSECEALLSGTSLSFTGTKTDGSQTQLTGTLERQKAPNGATFVGIKADFPLREGYVRGVFRKQEVTIKGSWSDHVFTPEELDRLFAGETIHISFTKKSGGTSSVDGKLAWQTYEGRKFLGFKADFKKK